MDFKKDEFVFIPLGGSEQFGNNLNVYGYKNKWLAVDCGIGFADHRYPGVDILLPDPKFLEERKEDLVGLIITHGHEDHIGAVPYLWPRLQCPIFCTPFTAAVLRSKFAERPDCANADIKVIKPHETIKVGPFKGTFIPVTHSIPQTCSILVETKGGRVLHSADWNLDPKPVIGEPINPDHFKDAAKKGILAYIGDSTNAEVKGRSGSEGDVEKGMAEVIKPLKGQVLVTIFSSNIGRIRSIAKAAQASNRSVCVIGRSIHKMVGNAKSCGYLNDIPDFITEDDATHLADDQVLYIATGSQGEARAQLSRIARGDHPTVSLNKGDTVIYSSRAIPGNETEIIKVQNNLAAAGVNIIIPKRTPHTIHVSGHPCRDEIKDMFEWLKPESVIAVHGERVMIEAQAQLARDCGIKTGIVPNNGSVIRLSPGTPEIIDHVHTGLLAVEPGRVIEADHKSLTQRRKLQYAGTAHITLVINARGDLVADPQISTVGLIDDTQDEGLDFEDDILNEVEDILADLTRGELKDDDYITEEVRIGVRRFVMHNIRIKPVTSVHVVRV